MARAVRWDLIADARKFNRGFREAERTADRVGKGIRRTATLIGGAFAAVQVAGFLKGAIDEAREAAKVGRQTQAVIKATGGVARVSAKDVDRLSAALSNKAGVDDEVIAAGANMLLTFKGVRNEVGRNNDIFNQASSVILDMTAAMHQGEVSQQGLEKATIQVGKALNDPIKGITALTRVGVTFTEKQKEQIRTLVEAGKTQQAQRIILAELRSEFGGAAAAAADSGQRFAVFWANIKEGIGKIFLPALDKAATFIQKTFVPQVERFWRTHGPEFGKAFDKIREKAATFIRELKENLEPQLKRIRDAWNDNKDAIKDLVSSLRGSQDEFATAEDTAKSFGDALVAATNFAGSLSRALKRVEGHINDFKDSSDKAAQAIHDKFIRPMAYSFAVLVSRWITGFHAMVRVAASAAEAMHLPWAKSLRRAEQDIGSFRSAFNRQMDALKDERVNLAVKGIFQPPAGMSMRDIVFRAEGGPIRGSGPRGKDSVLGMLAPGEHVWTDREVTAAGGHGAMERWRRAVRRGDIPEFARGGAVTMHQTLPSAGAFAAAADRSAATIAAMIARNVRATAPISTVNPPHAPGGWRVALDFLRSLGIPYNVISTFRPGARTHATGSVSYHALNRAVDLTGDMLRIWSALTRTNPTELIYSHAPRYKSRSGWHPIGQLDNVTFMDHLSHVHAAYRRGGRIPEDVFGMGRSGRTYSFHGGETVTPKGGIDYDALADTIVRALERRPPVVAVDDIHTGLLSMKRGRGRIKLGLD